MKHDITICTTSTNDEELVNLNIENTAKLNKNNNISWYVVLNKDPQKKNIIKINLNKNDLLINGNLMDEIGCGALNHGICFNRTISKIKSRFVLYTDPDFFTLKEGWIDSIIEYMLENNIGFFGAPWHPKWYIKFRYFPCHQFLLIDRNLVNLNDFDFRPINIYWTGSSNIYNSIQPHNLQNIEKNKRISIKYVLKKLIPSKFIEKYRNYKNYMFSIQSRKKNCWDGDSGARIYLKFINKKIKISLLKPVFNPKIDWQVPISWKLNYYFEKLLPEKLCYFPKDANYTYQPSDFGNELGGKGYEGFYWNNKPFSFHTRGFPRENKGMRNREDEILHIKKLFKQYSQK